jgi:hypothetical protein
MNQQAMFRGVGILVAVARLSAKQEVASETCYVQHRLRSRPPINHSNFGYGFATNPALFSFAAHHSFREGMFAGRDALFEEPTLRRTASERKRCLKMFESFLACAAPVLKFS